jgi:NADP-dependent 3-hydroxy acid dehydrogenase YdfG
VAALAGRAAVVTGASRGIGAAIADALRGAGAAVFRLARSLPSGGHDGFHDLRCDVTDPVAVEGAAARVLAGQIAVNLRASFYLARAFLPPMREARRGSFVTVGSVADHVAYPGNTAYAASKYGLRGLHETLAAEYRGSGVRITLVSPGPTDTRAWDQVNPDAREGFVRRADMLRPADVAEAVLFAVTRPPHVHIDWVRLNPVI